MSSQSRSLFQGKKIAIFHAFFVPKGGGEKLIFQMRNHYHADLFTGAIDWKIWNPERFAVDTYVKELFDPRFGFTFLHTDSKVPWWRKVKRQAYFKFSPKISKLNEYDLVIFSGNVAGVASRITNPKTKKITYCHTPPRPFTDQFESNLQKIPPVFHFVAKWFRNWVIWEYKRELENMDLVITNSENIHNRLKKYVGVDSISIYPAIDTHRFKFLGQKDYYLSYARLEHLKRIPLLIEAFAQMPDKNLVICSTGPLKDWVIKTIKERNLTNIEYRGLVSDEELEDLVGNCIAGVYIPVDEDAGITQCEIMSAGKPVIGVNEGGLKETIIHEKTGLLLPENPTIEDVVQGVIKMTPEYALTMKDASTNRAKEFDSSVFFQKMDDAVKKVLEIEEVERASSKSEEA